MSADIDWVAALVKVADDLWQAGDKKSSSAIHEALGIRRHGGEYCRRCGGPNVIWSAASPLWNYVMRGNDINGETKFSDLVCIPCFIVLAAEAGLPERGWRLTLVPEPPGLVYETPSGRIWDAEKFLWVEGF